MKKAKLEFSDDYEPMKLDLAAQAKMKQIEGDGGGEEEEGKEVDEKVEVEFKKDGGDDDDNELVYL